MCKIKVVVIGPSGEEILIDLCDTEEQLRRMTVKQLKEKIAERFPIHVDTVRLMINDKTLDEDFRLLSENGIQHMSDIHMIPHLSGGDDITETGDGGMGEKDCRNLSMERLEHFNTPSGSKCDIL